MATAIAMACVSGRAHAQINVTPAELEQVGVQEHLNDRVPADAVFRDHNGAMVRLGQFTNGRKPVLLMLVYHSCPMLCNMVTNATLNTLARVPWTVGEQFEAVTISIDPRDTPNDARSKRDLTLERYNRAPARNGWHFLTGNEANIQSVARSVGFQYRYDARQRQYAHPAVIFLLTPDGKIARYLYGIDFNPNDVRLGLLEASEGRSISTVERLIMFCYHYDPMGRKYALVAMRVMQLGGALTASLLFGTIATLSLRNRRDRSKDGTGGGGTGGPDGSRGRDGDTEATSMAPLTTPRNVRG